MNIPKSLKSTAKKRSLKDMLSAKKAQIRAGETSSGYAQLKDMVNSMEMFAGEIKIQFMFIDAFWSAIGPYLTPAGGSVLEGAVTITFTQEMANEMISYDSEGLDPVVDSFYIDMIKEMYNAMVGMQFPCPALTIVLDPNDVDKDGYHFSVTYSFGNTVAKNLRSTGLKADVTTSSDNTIMKWNTAKTLVSITYTYDMSDPTFGTFSGSSKFVYDSVAKKLTYKGADEFYGIQSSYSFTLEETGTANGVKISANFTFKDPSTSFENTYDIEGIADDNGGFIKDTFKYSDGTTSFVFYYQELFDGTGTLTGWSYSIDGITWYTETGYTDPTTSTYDDTPYTISDVITIDAAALTAQLTAETAEFAFVIVPAGTTYDAANPDPFYAAMIGSGYYFFDVDVPSNSSVSYVDYWGTVDQITGALVFKESYDTNTNVFSYTLMSGVTISQAVK